MIIHKPSTASTVAYSTNAHFQALRCTPEGFWLWKLNYHQDHQSTKIPSHILIDVLIEYLITMYSPHSSATRNGPNNISALYSTLSQCRGRPVNVRSNISSRSLLNVRSICALVEQEFVDICC